MRKSEVCELMDQICELFELDSWSEPNWPSHQRKKFSDKLKTTLGIDKKNDKYFERVKKDLDNYELHSEFRPRSSVFEEIKAAFEKYKSTAQIPKELQSLVGNWRSFARASWDPDLILTAPVEIFEEDNKIVLAMIGGEKEFKGEVRKISSNIVVYLEPCDKKKAYTFILKIPNFDTIVQLKGVYSGVNGKGHPVSGLEVLQRESRNSHFSNKAVSMNITEFEQGFFPDSKKIADFLTSSQSLVVKD